MKTLIKSPDKDFLILNLTDPQLGNGEWEESHPNRALLEGTIKELIRRTSPSLITVTGDISWAGHTDAYKAFADFIDSFGIPWAPVWGNHDNQDGPAFIDSIADLYMTYKNCLYEKGDPALGNGNYIIAIEENGKIIEGIFMIDAHDQSPYVKPDGEEVSEWAKLIPEQLDWYKEEAAHLKELGCNDTSWFLHIPIYAYREAFAAAFNGSAEDARMVKPEESGDEKYWNDGYKDSFGVNYEGICSYPADEGALDAILEIGTTHHIVVGHDHVNNAAVRYKGVRMIYGTKAGAGCYWNPVLNGGTLLRVTKDGITDVWHEYVDPAGLEKKIPDVLKDTLATKFDLTCGEDGKFRVLCVSDFHARNEQWDPRLKLSLEALVKAHRPHLVFIAGDLAHDDEGLGSDDKLREYLADVMEICEKEKIAWAHVPGNHDREAGIPTRVFNEFPMNLSERGPDSVSGYGTYAIPVWPHDGSKAKGPVCMIWAFDSHMGLGGYAERHGLNPGDVAWPNLHHTFGNYDSVNFNQAAWYWKNSAALEKLYGRKIPGVMIMHAPVAEMFLIPANTYLTGATGELAESIGGAALNSGLFAAAYERGDIREMVAGHDHINSISGTYMGIRLTEDASLGFDVYGDNRVRGGRLMEFDANDPAYYETKHVYIKDLLPPEAIAGANDF
ncbi:MAG: metallophosphoesterase [Clostridia bacterium]|nr:metallophosphoesterase [Clostridia bacterium]